MAAEWGRLLTAMITPMTESGAVNDAALAELAQALVASGTEGLVVADGSVLPTSLGVNPQESIMSVATRIAWRLRDRGLPER